MYGDPRGHKQTGREEWYQFTPNLHLNRLTEIYVWSMDRKDLERLPKEGWIGFLEGTNPGYPEQALRASLDFIRRRVREMENDQTSADTRLADYLMGYNPASIESLVELAWGTYLSGNIWSLHARLRYFDPVRRRAGLPEDVAALVEKLTADSVTVTLVNTNQVQARSVVVQAGGYGEHQFVSAAVDGRTAPLDASHVTARLAPGSGARVEFQMKRYANRPTASFPWER
jgi:hypothetical protein